MGFDERKSVVDGGCKQQMRRHILVLHEYWILTEIRIPLKPYGDRGVRIVAHTISSHEQTQYNRESTVLWC